MNVMESSSSLEALALHYVRFGLFTVGSNLWTWLALVAAAVSFWRITAVKCCREPHVTSASACSDVSSSGSDEVVEEPASRPVTASPIVSTPATTTSFSFCGWDGTDGVTKDKFVVYYEDGLVEEREEEEEEGECDKVVAAAEDEEEWWVSGGGGGGDWWVSWEKMMRVRSGESGWYRCQDLSALNGSVVRLWDESKNNNNLLK